MLKKTIEYIFGTDKKALIVVIIFALAILLVPNVVRLLYFENYMLSDTPYYHAKIAQDILTEPEKFQIGQEPNIYHYLLAYSSKYINILTATNLLPFLTGIFSTLFFYLLLRNFNFSIKRTALITFLWISSPLYIYSFTVSNPFSMIILLNISGLYFLQREKASWISIPLFSLIPLFGFQHSILSVFMIFLYTNYYKKKWKLGLSAIVVLIAISIIIIITSGYNLTSDTGFEKINILENNIVEFGAILGFNSFVFILALIGLVMSWKRKYIFSSIYVVLTFLIIASYYLDSQFKIFMNIFVSLYAAMGLISLVKMKWEQKILRDLTLFILICGLLFSTTSYINRLSILEPDIEMVESLYWLKENSGTNDVILSHYNNAYWIEFFSDRRVVLRPGDNMEVYNETSQLFVSRNEQEVLEIIEKYDIKYFYVDEKTYNLMVDDNNRIGLVFLMENSADFKEVYKIKDDLSIWKIN